jgi:DegV family protein with EDD domain
MSFQIITDSASDMPQETAQKLGVVVMPIHTRFGDEEFLDGVTMKPHEFFDRLVNKKQLPRTSQITPYEFGQEYEKAVAAGRGVLCITMSSGVSGTCQSACAAAADYEGQVEVIDSRQFCISLYALVEYACRLRDEGKTLQEAAALVEKAKKRVHVISVFATLEYLKLGGRISSAAAVAGSILSIKPVITINEGVVDVIAKARGSKKANNMLVEFIDKVGGVDKSMPYCLGFTGFSDEVLMKYVEDYAPMYKEELKDVKVVPVGATVGTYAGPGAVALAFFNN